MKAAMRYLKLLLARASVGRALLRHGERLMSGTARGPSEPTEFRQDEFARDPSTVMRRAERDGSVVITNAAGEPRMRISVPLDDRQIVLD